jgi:hypothetical protein
MQDGKHSTYAQCFPSNQPIRERREKRFWLNLPLEAGYLKSKSPSRPRNPPTLSRDHQDRESGLLSAVLSSGFHAEQESGGKKNPSPIS